MDDLKKHPYYYYYQVGNQKFSSKLFASYAKTKINEDVIWHFPNWEKSLSEMNITEEPKETLTEMYLQRAKQLRNEYDYLVLFYSGGNDSNQILETFMLNGIFLDEIVIFTRVAKNIEKIQVPEYYESLKSAIPQARFYVENFSPLTKITIAENYERIHANYIASLNEREINNMVSSCSPGIVHRFVVRSKNLTRIDKGWQRIAENKKIGHIYGKEKVKLRYDDVGYYILMNDIQVVDYVDLRYVLSDDSLPNNMELFYIHPDFAKIHVKQAHILINNISKDYITSEKNNVLLTRNIEDMYSRYIYSFKYHRLYTGVKCFDLLIGERKNLTKKEKEEIMNSKNVTGEYSIEYHVLNTEKAKKNYDKLINTIKSSFFSNTEEKYFVNFSHKGLDTKKYYVKYF